MVRTAHINTKTMFVLRHQECTISIGHWNLQKWTFSILFPVQSKKEEPQIWQLLPVDCWSTCCCFFSNCIWTSLANSGPCAIKLHQTANQPYFEHRRFFYRKALSGATLGIIFVYRYTGELSYVGECCNYTIQRFFSGHSDGQLFKLRQFLFLPQLFQYWIVLINSIKTTKWHFVHWTHYGLSRILRQAFMKVGIGLCYSQGSYWL